MTNIDEPQLLYTRKWTRTLSFLVMFGGITAPPILYLMGLFFVHVHDLHAIFDFAIIATFTMFSAACMLSSLRTVWRFSQNRPSLLIKGETACFTPLMTGEDTQVIDLRGSGSLEAVATNTYYTASGKLRSLGHPRHVSFYALRSKPNSNVSQPIEIFLLGLADTQAEAEAMADEIVNFRGGEAIYSAQELKMKQISQDMDKALDKATAVMVFVVFGLIFGTVILLDIFL